MQKNFYQQKIEKIKQNIQNNEYSKAYKMVLKEINMPYIPIQYEKQFQVFKEKLELYFNKKKLPQSINITQVLDLLNGNENEQLIALENISKFNLRNYKNYLKKRIESWENNFKKAILYEILFEQKINIDININGKIINPSSFSVLNNKETLKAYKELEKLSLKKPYLLSLSFSELQRYILLNFPKVVNNGKILAKIIFNIVLSMFENKKILSKNEKKIKEILRQKNKVV